MTVDKAPNAREPVTTFWKTLSGSRGHADPCGNSMPAKRSIRLAATNVPVVGHTYVTVPSTPMDPLVGIAWSTIVNSNSRTTEPDGFRTQAAQMVLRPDQNARFGAQCGARSRASWRPIPRWLRVSPDCHR